MSERPGIGGGSRVLKHSLGPWRVLKDARGVATGASCTRQRAPRAERAFQGSTAKQPKRPTPSARDGFALLAVLWLVVALAGLTAGALAAARSGAETTAARVAAVRGRWAAEGCLAVALGVLDSAVRAGRAFALPAIEPLRFANGAQCNATARDPNATREPVFGDGRLNVNAASDARVLALPGFGPDALRALASARAWHRPIGSLDELLAALPPTARSAMVRHYPELVQSVAFRATSLVLSAGGGPDSHTAARIELHVAPAGGRVAILRRRLW